jgi:hypothetical protein
LGLGTRGLASPMSPVRYAEYRSLNHGSAEFE